MTRDEKFIPSVAVAQFSGDLHGMSAEDANALLTGLLSDISVDCTAADRTALSPGASDETARATA